MGAVVLKLLNLALPSSTMSEHYVCLRIYTLAHTHKGSNLPMSARPQLAGPWEGIASARRLERTRSARAPLQCKPS